MTIRTKINSTKERGISLLIVMLIGMFILLTSVTIGLYATRMIQALRVREDAIQTLYAAEGAFGCVRYWANNDYRHFTDEPDVEPDATIYCNGTDFNFSTGNDSAPSDGADPEYYIDGTGSGVSKFRIPDDNSNPEGPGVYVKVIRSDPTLAYFDANIRVYSRSGWDTSFQKTERYQDYYYRVLYGADIVFVVDRSGSIAGNRSNRAEDSEWNDMLDALVDSINLLDIKVPKPFMSIVSFGDDAENTGKRSTECSFLECNWREPDVQLTDDITLLLNGDTPVMADYSKSNTNLSLGISIAGSELMGKYYPHSGLGDPRLLPVPVPYGHGSGDFEDIVLNNGSFTDLPDQSDPGDRDDTVFPDVIVVLTDGAPNGIMTHQERTWDWGFVNNETPPEFAYGASPHLYQIGEAKIFRTRYPGAGELIVDDMTGVSGSTIEYDYCDDELEEPDDVLRNIADPDGVPYYAMCNVTKIADRLKDEGIKIIGIFVFDGCPFDEDNPPYEAEWMREHLVSEGTNGSKLLGTVCSYEEVKDTMLELFERLNLVQSR